MAERRQKVVVRAVARVSTNAKAFKRHTSRMYLAYLTIGTAVLTLRCLCIRHVRLHTSIVAHMHVKAYTFENVRTNTYLIRSCKLNLKRKDQIEEATSACVPQKKLLSKGKRYLKRLEQINVSYAYVRANAYFLALFALSYKCSNKRRRNESCFLFFHRRE